MKLTDRRSFIKKSALAGAGATYLMSSGNVWGFSPNEQVNVAIIGTGGRSYAITQAFSLCTNVKVTHACDVDSLRLDKYMAYAKENLGYAPKSEKDFRKILKNKSVDAIVVTTPEHWHAPMAIMGMAAGKHVYVEKPCSHNLAENELLIDAYKKFGKVCQMGNQQRSSFTSQLAMKDIQDGKIGEVYFANAWYSNTRGPIGVGKKIAVPDTLDWDLWQGPAPREQYRDNVHPYNWHWFRTWGTGEIHNNGTHEIDICRWALGVKYPQRVTSTGGRLHFQGDDWEYFDTQTASFEFEGGKSIVWDGKSCNGLKPYGKGRGVSIQGTEGSIVLDREGYQLLDLKGKEISYQEEGNAGTSNSTVDTSGFDGLTVKHLQNFINAIREGEALRAPIDQGSVSTHLCHLGNIAQDLHTTIEIDSKTGRISNNPEALEMIKRQYESGWEPMTWL
ncbi:MAG: Gfo/Idh/MocA family oxidoreductase [Cyclobacteriaceae bacterium]